MSLVQNIGTKGRVVRAVGAIALGVCAWLVWPSSPAASIALGVAAVFVAYEAVRGWCALRACGLKTPF